MRLMKVSLPEDSIMVQLNSDHLMIENSDRLVKDYDFRWADQWWSMVILKSCIGPAQMQAEDKAPVAMGFV